MLGFQQFKQLSGYLQKLNDAPVGPFVGGFVMGMFLGLIPASINSFIITLLLFILSVDKTAGVIAAGLFGMLGLFLDPVAHQIGYFVLTLPFLKGIFTSIYNAPFMAFTGFNNTLVMGNTLLGIILIYPAILLVKKFLTVYRQSGFKEQAARLFASKYFSLFNKIFGVADMYSGDTEK